MKNISDGLRGGSSCVSQSWSTLTKFSFFLILLWLLTGSLFLYFTTFHGNSYFQYESNIAIQNIPGQFDSAMDAFVSQAETNLPGGKAIQDHHTISFIPIDSWPNGPRLNLTSDQIHAYLTEQGFFRILHSNILICFFYAFVLSSILILLLGYWAYKTGSSANKLRITNDALPLIEYSEAVKQSQKYDGDFKILDIKMPKDYETRHELVLGTTGSGKSNYILKKLTRVRELKQPAIVYSLKDEFVAKFYRPGIDIILNPFDERCEPWGINSEITGNPDDFLKFKNMADSFVTGNYNDEFWINSPRKLFEEFARSLYVNGKLTNKAFVDQILKMDMCQLREQLSNTHAASLVGKDVEKTTTNIIMTLVNAISGFRYLINDSKRIFSLAKWFKFVKNNHDSWIFVCPGNKAYLANAKQLYTGWLDLCANYCFDLGRDKAQLRRIHFIVDEADTLNNMPSILDLLTKGRDYGVCVTLGIQNVAQALQIYGREIFRIIMGNCNSILVFSPGGDQDSAEFLSKIFQNMDVEETQESESYSPDDSKKVTKTRTKVKKEKPVVGPDALMRLERFECFLRIANRNPVKLKFSYYAKEDISVGLIPRDLSYLFDEYRKETLASTIQGEQQEDPKLIKRQEESQESEETDDLPAAHTDLQVNEDNLKLLINSLLMSEHDYEAISKMLGIPVEIIIQLETITPPQLKDLAQQSGYEGQDKKNDNELDLSN